MLSIRSTFYILFLSSSLLFSQSTISGRVIDSETQKPLPYANVFLSKTTIGASSDLDGYFRVENVPNGSYELVVQYLGYELVVFNITILEKKSFQLSVKLKPKPLEGKEIVIEAPDNKWWRKRFKEFKEQFLGFTENAQQSEIINPLSINFYEDRSDNYVATCDSCLIVENRSLGYKINIVLQHFEWNKTKCYHRTYSKFNESEPESEDEYQRWLKNREKTYKGSFKHFFSSLLTYHKDIVNYKIFLTHEKIYKSKGLYYPISKNYLYEFISDSIGLKKIKLEDFLYITYNDGSKEMEAGFVLKGKEKYLLLDNLGTVMNPIQSKRYGYWGYLRFADLLPDDYQPVINNN